MKPAATATCACALRDHRPKSLGTKPEPTRFPTLTDGWAAPQTAAKTSAVDGAAAGTDPYRQVPLSPFDRRQERSRERERRRNVATAKNVLPALAIVAALLVLSRCDGDGNEAVTPRSPSGPAAGEPAVWKVDPAQPPKVEASAFTALVSPLGCGEAEDVLAPQVIENPVSVVVIFRVAPATTDGTDACASGTPVSTSVRLATRLGDRTLFDGTCDVPPGLTAPECLTAQRWPLSG